MAITLSLGRWQLSRAAQKEALQAAISEQKTLPVLDGRALAATKDIANVLHRRVVLQGTWLPQYTV
ncbi:MAG: SURF1 family protein, partial [Xylophilus sp.]|nr:SURF1 family protein [Xylophilus sp.]